MSDLRLKRLQLRNWMKVKTADITFPEKGLVLVLGSNLAAQGKLRSVGAGKTSLGEALSYALTGATGRFEHFGHNAPDDAPSDTYIKVEADLLDQPLTVEVGFKCKELSKTGEGLRFQHGDVRIERGRIEQTREELSRVVRVTPDLAKWTVFLDGDMLKFNRMSQEDSVKLLMTALAQPPWTEYYERVTKKLRTATQDVHASTTALRDSKSRIESLEKQLAGAIEEHAEAKEEYARRVAEVADKIAGLRAENGKARTVRFAAEVELKNIKGRLSLLEEQQAKRNHQLDIERQSLRDMLAVQDDIMDQAVGKRATAKSKLRQTEDTLRTMLSVPKTCPTCDKPWDKAHGEVELEKARQQAEKAKTVVAEAEIGVVKIDEERKRIRDKIAGIDNKMRTEGKTGEVIKLGESYEDTEDKISDLNAEINAREVSLARLDQGVDSGFVTSKLAIIAERKRTLEAEQRAVEDRAGELALNEQVLKIVQYWHKAYSPTGIPNMVLSDAIPALNRVALRISNMMTAGTLQVSYSTTKTLATGESKAHLITKVENKIGSKRLEGGSKGERGLVNLIIAENLSEVGRVSQRAGFRWYDEVTSGQDDQVRRSIFAYLKEVASRLGILIFVVDHHAEISNFADHVLVAEKTVEYGTRYSWRQ